MRHIKSDVSEYYDFALNKNARKKADMNPPFFFKGGQGGL
jgi:hypothetical protein